MKIKLFFLTVVLLVVSACGGSKSDDGEGQETSKDPGVITTTPVYGLFELELRDKSKRTVVISRERSYIFSVAKQESFVSELMCLSEEYFYEFVDNHGSQSLNFMCKSGVDGLNGSEYIYLELSLNGEDINVTYTHVDEVHNFTLDKSDINKILPPSFHNADNGYYVNEVRDDIDISRHIYIQKNIESMGFQISSRDWPSGGYCLSQNNFLLEDLSLIKEMEDHLYLDFSYNEYRYKYAGDYWGCVGKVLPIGQPYGNIMIHIYSLEDKSHVVVFEQYDFMTMGIIFKQN